jgi:hypothetical protein
MSLGRTVQVELQRRRSVGGRIVKVPFTLVTSVVASTISFRKSI